MAEIVQMRPRKRGEMEPLWRDVLGRSLRDLRLLRGETLTDTAAKAGISPQYLSEIERGRKEPSSEIIAAVAGALGVTLIDLTTSISRDLRGSATAYVEQHSTVLVFAA